MVGLIPLFAVETARGRQSSTLPGLHAADAMVHRATGPTSCERVSTARPRTERVRAHALARRSVDDGCARPAHDARRERSFSRPTASARSRKYHSDHPYSLRIDGDVEHRVDYEPAESTTGVFGGNSNWRGPVWFPVNYLLIESLQSFHYYFGDDFKVECPTGSGKFMNLWEVAAELSRRLMRLFLPGQDGRRPLFGRPRSCRRDPHFRELLCSSNISTATTARAWARCTRPAGPAWSPS